MSHINCLLVVWELHYIGRDYLGSITHIADSEGNLVAEYSYDAWGRLRDPATQELYGNSGVSDLLLWRRTSTATSTPSTILSNTRTTAASSYFQ